MYYISLIFLTTHCRSNWFCPILFYFPFLIEACHVKQWWCLFIWLLPASHCSIIKKTYPFPSLSYWYLNLMGENPATYRQSGYIGHAKPALGDVWQPFKLMWRLFQIGIGFHGYGLSVSYPFQLNYCIAKSTWRWFQILSFQ